MTENPMPEIEVGDWVKWEDVTEDADVTEVRSPPSYIYSDSEIAQHIVEIRKPNGTRWLRTPEGRTP